MLAAKILVVTLAFKTLNYLSPFEKAPKVQRTVLEDPFGRGEGD